MMTPTAPMTRFEAQAVLDKGDFLTDAYRTAYEVVYGFRPEVSDFDPESVRDAGLEIHWPGNKEKENRVEKKRTRLTPDQLQSAVDLMESAAEVGIGTFHIPAFDNMKVKFDKESGVHYIWAELL
jgi:hypothetical protein